jgi:adenosylmethionine-8-amino-7-oxononanoate aminotransferase
MVQDSDRYPEWDSHYVHALNDAADRQHLTVLVDGQGAWVRDAQGRRYLDGVSGLWNVHLGHGRPELVAAATAQLQRLAFGHTYSGFANRPALELAARLEAVAYPGLTATFFTASGADANEAAFKTARYYWRRRGKPAKVKILSLEHGYHGSTLAAMSATGISGLADMFAPRLDGFVRVPAPYPYRCDFSRPGEGPGRAAVRRFQEILQAEGPDTVAALIAEPVQGAGGVIVPPPDYFPHIRELCTRHEILFIADEIITGFGRTGEWFGLTHWGVQPDLMTVAKGITSGYLPLGAMMVSAPVLEVLDTAAGRERWSHSSTYSGHPVCCAVGLAVLDILEREALVARAAQMGRALLHRLQDLADLEAVGEIRGLGLMAAVELVADRTHRTPFDAGLKLGDEIRRRAHEAGLILRNRGDVLQLAPPLVVSDEELQQLVAIVRKSILGALEAVGR